MSSPTPEGVERRVVLVKPGDLLLIGNVGELQPDDADALSQFLGGMVDKLGIRVALFERDIEIDHLPGGAGG